MNMTAKRIAEVTDIMEHIGRYARTVVGRVDGIGSTCNLSDDEFKALAKEVEEVGELVHQLESTNPCIVPALFEVPYGKWKGWSGLANYRNVLAHSFRTITPEELLDRVNNKLSLQEVADLLGTVTTIGMMTQAMDFGSESIVKNLPRSAESVDLLPGSSVITLRFDEAGELLAIRSWRDERDNWRASTRWVRKKEERDDRIVLGIRDTEILLAPTVMSSHDDYPGGSYNLLFVPAESYFWNPRVLAQRDSTHVRNKKRS